MLGSVPIGTHSGREAAALAVLGVLAPGGMLTVDQLARQTPLTKWTARQAVALLRAQGRIRACPGQARWSITPRGRAALERKCGAA